MKMSGNPLEEYGNEPPPINLDKEQVDPKNERAIIRYVYQDKAYYLVIEKLKKTTTEFMY